jgi:phosphatidylethanolamine/phosphatidyl-N-methylethanolamine N-methyltransferase
MNVDAVGRFYNRFAGAYDLMFDHVFREGRTEAIRAMNLWPGDHVLEVGVGTGLTLPYYPRAVRVTGIDVSAPMLREARRRLDRAGRGNMVALARMDAAHLALPDNSFDAVFAPYVVSVVPTPRRVVAEMARVCKPGGVVVVVNHFGSRRPVGRWVERRLSPLTHRVGFRLDLPVEDVLGLSTLLVEEDRRVNLLHLWRLLVFRKIESVGERTRRLGICCAERSSVSSKAVETTH